MALDRALSTSHEGRLGETLPTEGLSLHHLIPPTSPEGESWSWLTAPEWWADAACRGVGPGLFFTFRGELTDDAKAVCDSCQARAECLAQGMRERNGVWGGTSERERRKLRRAS